MAGKSASLLRSLVALAILFEVCLASSKFLTQQGVAVDAETFQEEIMTAIGSMLGCGGQASAGKVSAIRSVLTPMWRTLPKNDDRVDRRSLRYLVHRYFMQTSSLMIRGFEPTRPVNESHWGVADVLSQMVPAYVEKVLDAKHNAQHGFSLQDAVDMVVMLDQLIFDSESTKLERVYHTQRKPVDRPLSSHGLDQVLEAYMITWMIDASPEDHDMLLANRSFAAEILPHFNLLMDFAKGSAKAFDYKRQRRSATLSSAKKSHSRDAWNKKYSFDDAHEIVGGITRSFQSFWQSECESMKTALVGMDKRKTGRVPLSKFYNTAVNTDWRFGESESYLRELGALDESSTWLGKQVIIPNYLQATSNCIVSTSHYLVCCVNECESLLGEIETAIGTATALSSDILAVVRNLTSPTSIDEDDQPHLSAALVSQLEQVGRKHGGFVPLHGRLFAQWLHYVFPRECPFPHKVGMVSSVTPSEYGRDHVATTEEMKMHASNASAFDFVESVGNEELHWMSQWSHEEELMVDYSSELRASWHGNLVVIVAVICALGSIGWGVAGYIPIEATSKHTGSAMHSHWV